MGTPIITAVVAADASAAPATLNVGASYFILGAFLAPPSISPAQISVRFVGDSADICIEALSNVVAFSPKVASDAPVPLGIYVTTDIGRGTTETALLVATDMAFSVIDPQVPSAIAID